MFDKAFKYCKSCIYLNSTNNKEEQQSQIFKRQSQFSKDIVKFYH